MIRLSTKSFTLTASILAFSAACSDVGINGTGGKRKEPKKKALETEKAGQAADGSDNQGSTEASAPQVVTGSYLACIPDNSVPGAPGEVAFGCGVYDVTDKKIEMGKSSVTFAADDGKGTPAESRQVAAPESSNFHAHLFTKNFRCDDPRFSAVITSENGQTLKFETRTIKFKSASEGKKIPENYTLQEISAWCAKVTARSLAGVDMFSHVRTEKGVACGGDYLAAVGGTIPVITIQIDIEIGNLGICEREGLSTNKALNIERCK